MASKKVGQDSQNNSNIHMPKLIFGVSGTVNRFCSNMVQRKFKPATKKGHTSPL
jgi:hypothetical protein